MDHSVPWREVIFPVELNLGVAESFVSPKEICSSPAKGMATLALDLAVLLHMSA